MYSNLDTWTFLWQQSAGPMYLPLQIKVREIVERVELRVNLQLMWPAVHESHLMIDIFAKYLWDMSSTINPTLSLSPDSV